MASNTLGMRYCAWCLEEVNGAKCPVCRERTRGPEDVALVEHHRFSGMVVANRYRITRFVGAGGMGEVYRAYDKRADRMVAIKFLLPSEHESRTENIKSHRRFTQECEILARLESPYIVRFLDDERTADGTPALVMELLAGQTLHRLINRTQHLGTAEIVDIGVPICRALQAAHARNYVHRDLKPANIFLHDPGDGTRVVKVLDFGIAKIVDEDRIGSNPTRTIGTLEYMSPEHCGRGAISPKSDLFSLGTILYQMATGRLPFEAPGTVSVLMAIAYKAPVPIDPNLGLPNRFVDLVSSRLRKVNDKK